MSEFMWKKSVCVFLLRLFVCSLNGLWTTRNQTLHLFPTTEDGRLTFIPHTPGSLAGTDDLYLLFNLFLFPKPSFKRYSLSESWVWAFIHKQSFMVRKKRWGKRERRERKNTEKARVVSWVPFFAIPFPMHLVCVWAREEREREGGPVVWGRLITNDL